MVKRKIKGLTPSNAYILHSLFDDSNICQAPEMRGAIYLSLTCLEQVFENDKYIFSKQYRALNVFFRRSRLVSSLLQGSFLHFRRRPNQINWTVQNNATFFKSENLS